MSQVQFISQRPQKVANLWNTDHALAVEGGYYVSTNPTPGTGIATTTSITAEDQTKPVFMVYNSANPADPDAVSLYPLALQLLCTAAPTSATLWQYSWRLDNVANKYTSGGSTLTPKNVNGGLANSSAAVVYFGALVTLTMSVAAGRLVGGGMVNPTIPIVKDTTLFTFGDSNSPGTLVNAASVNKTTVLAVPPVIVPPGWYLALQMWGASNAGAPAWEFQFDHVER